MLLFIIQVALTIAFGIGCYFYGKRINLNRTKSSIEYWVHLYTEQAEKFKELKIRNIDLIKDAARLGRLLSAGKALSNEFEKKLIKQNVSDRLKQSEADKLRTELEGLKEQVEWIDFLEPPKQTKMPGELKEIARSKAIEKTLNILNEFDRKLIPANIRAHFRTKFSELITDLIYRSYKYTPPKLTTEKLNEESE